MKALIIYFTSLGRTKKTAEVIGNALTNYEVDYSPFELTGKFGKKVSIQTQHTNGDFSSIEEELSELEEKNLDYNLIVIGMPTYGNLPPSAFYEIVKRMDINGKKVVIFDTCSLNGVQTLELMRKTVEKTGAIIVDQARFKGFFKPKLKEATKFGHTINNLVVKSDQ
ncbi:MAG: flavodoxin family protein [Candidatus Heimdallarchaeaceae archaeon]